MNSSKHINTFFSLSLLLVFVVCAFLLLLMQIQGYQQINTDNDYQSEVHMPVSYISNKVKSADSILVEDNMLILQSGKMKTYIYQDEGLLKEASIVQGYEMDPSLGESLFDCDLFEVNLTNTSLDIEFGVNDIVKEYHFMNRKGELE